MGSGRYYLKQWAMDFSLCGERKWNQKRPDNRSERKGGVEIKRSKDELCERKD